MILTFVVGNVFLIFSSKNLFRNFFFCSLIIFAKTLFLFSLSQISHILQKFLSNSLGQLPKEKERVFTPLQFHRSLTIQERLKSEILFKKTSDLKQKNFLEDQIKEEKERQKSKERENYKYKQYIDKNFEHFNLEEIQRQEDARFKQNENKKFYDEQIREKNVQLQKERKAAILEEVYIFKYIYTCIYIYIYIYKYTLV
jgi:hypothetical protein